MVGICLKRLRRYVLAEFADQVPDRSPAQLAEELTPRLALAPVATQGLLLTALMKLRMHAPHDKGLKRHVEEIFTQYASDANTDIQQRAVEYLAYSKMESNEVVRQEVFAPMPDWPDKVMLFTPQVRLIHPPSVCRVIISDHSLDQNPRAVNLEAVSINADTYQRVVCKSMALLLNGLL